ncbi:MAG: hypothetical protein R3C18_15555 [Planctomycetaceae bacterium]
MLRILGLLTTFAAVTPGFGQEVGPGNVAFNPTWDATRSHAPRFLDVQVNWPLPQLLEGSLEVENYRDSTLLNRWHSYETAITSPGQTLKLTLPPTLLDAERQRHIYRVQFHGRNQTIYLDEHDRPSELRWKRSMVVGVLEDRDTTVPAGMLRDADSIQFAASVKIEDYVYSGNSDDINELRGWQQHVTTVPPVRLPDDPLRLLAFDILLASTEQIAKLDAAQLEALRLWTEGGGSLGISIAQPVPQRLGNWLNEIAGGTRVDPVLTVTQNGDVRFTESNSSRIHLSYPGIGRAIVVRQEVYPDSWEWQKAMLHLWKVRETQFFSVQRRQRFQFTKDADWTTFDPYEPLPWDPTFDSSATTLTDLLIPSQVSGVPLWIVCSVLGVCLLIVVPGDYVILGTFKLRRWTWMVVPIVAIACTWYMVRTANNYMGNQDHSQTLTFVDMNQELEPVRWSRYELLFPATTKELNRPMNHVFEVDLGESGNSQEGTPVGPDPDTATRDEFRQYAEEALSGSRRINLSRSDISSYTGSIPAEYSVRRQVNQWTPRVIRQTSFQPFQDVDASWLKKLPPISEWPRPAQNPAFYLEMGNQFESLKGNAILLFLGSEPPQIASGARALERSVERPPKSEPDDSISSSAEESLPLVSTGNLQVGSYVSLKGEISPRMSKVATYVGRQTNRQDKGLFRIVGQVSPLATELSEDLAIAPDKPVVIVIIANDDESAFTAWRFVIAK